MAKNKDISKPNTNILQIVSLNCQRKFGINVFLIVHKIIDNNIDIIFLKKIGILDKYPYEIEKNYYY